MLTAADTAYSTAFMRALEKERPASERLFEDPYAALFQRGRGPRDGGDVAVPRRSLTGYDRRDERADGEQVEKPRGPRARRLRR